MIDLRRRESGFTLMEILVVVLIIGLLTTLVASRLLSRADDAKITLAGAQLQKVAQALELYKLDNGRYPTTEQGLDALVTEPLSDPRPRRFPPGGYLKRADLEDPWGVTFDYAQPGSRNTFSYDLFSWGPDGQEGGEADITNWENGEGT